MTHQSNMMFFSRKSKQGHKPWWWVKSKNHITTKMRWINGANQTNPVFFPTNSVFIVLFQTFDLRVLGRLPICWSIHRLKLHIGGGNCQRFWRFRKYQHSDPLPIEMEDLPWNWLCFKKHQPLAILDTLQKTRVSWDMKIFLLKQRTKGYIGYNPSTWLTYYM